MPTTLAAELDERLTGIEASQGSLLTKINGLIASVALLDNKVSAIVPAIEASEATLLLGQQALAAAIAGPALYEMKAFQFDDSGESFTVETGLDLDTGGDNVLAPCTVVFGCVPRDGTVDVIMGASPTLNNSPLIIRITGSKLRVYAGTAINSQKFDTGSATWTQGDAHLGGFIWDGADMTLVTDGVEDTPSASSTRSSSSQGHLGKLLLNENGNSDVWGVAYIRGVLTVAQVAALQAKIAAGNLEEAAEDIAAYNASAGCLVGPTADDDSTTVAGITEHVAGRTTNVSGSPALIDVPS